MGEMSDFELDKVFDEEENLLKWKLGAISFDEAFNAGIIDELGYGNDIRTFENDVKACKYCGKTGLKWKIEKKDKKYRLFDGEKIHRCEKVKLQNWEKSLM